MSAVEPGRKQEDAPDFTLDARGIPVRVKPPQRGGLELACAPVEEGGRGEFPGGSLRLRGRMHGVGRLCRRAYEG